MSTINTSKIEILDTSFRDGIQGDNKRPTIDDAVLLVDKMVELGFDYIELGFVGDKYTDELAKKLLTKGLENNLTVFGRTRKPNEDVSETSDAKKIADLGLKNATIVCKSRLVDVENSLRTDAKTNLEMIGDTVKYLKEKKIKVILDLEHAVDAFFTRGAFGEKLKKSDATQNKEHFFDILDTAIKAKADCIVVCDTNGKASPEEISKMFNFLTQTYPNNNFGFHAHNDRSLAVANSRAAVQAGAMHIQGTVDGSGERCGNTNLTTLIPDLQVNDGMQIVSKKVLENFTSFADEFALAFDRKIPDSTPYVGRYAFTTRAGMHICGETRQKGCYTFCDPSLVGNKAKVIVDGQSGKSGIILKAKNLGLNLSQEQVEQFISKYFDVLKNGGFAESDASFELACHKIINNYKYPFTVKSYQASTSNLGVSKVSLELEVNKKIKKVEATGTGIFDALFKALKESLEKDNPKINQINLLTYDSDAVNVSHGGSESLVRVLIRYSDSSGKVNDWSTIGLNANSIKAGFDAIVDSLYYFLLKQKVV